MSNNISDTALKHFFIKEIGGDKISHDKAKSLGIKESQFDEANENDNNYLEIDEVLEDKDLYAQFATMYVQEQEAKAEEKDKDKEKEEQNKVQDKNGAGKA